jgi:hypothetical protein
MCGTGGIDYELETGAPMDYNFNIDAYYKSKGIVIEKDPKL